VETNNQIPNSCITTVLKKIQITSNNCPENCRLFIGSFTKPSNSLSSIHHTTPLISSVIGGHVAQNIDHFISEEKIKGLWPHSVKPVTSIRFYPSRTALHLDECKIIFRMKYNNQIVYITFPFLDVFPGYHQISIAAQDWTCTKLCFCSQLQETVHQQQMGDAKTQILACHELSQTRCSKRPFRKFAYPWDSREKFRERE